MRVLRTGRRTLVEIGIPAHRVLAVLAYLRA